MISLDVLMRLSRMEAGSGATSRTLKERLFRRLRMNSGLTSSPAIARYVADMVKNILM